jgi:hypothetical protein
VLRVLIILVILLLDHLGKVIMWMEMIMMPREILLRPNLEATII